MYNIGIDVGGTNISGGIVDAGGKIIFKKAIPALPSRTSEIIVADIIALCKNLIEESAIPACDIQSVGVGSPGMINPQSGTVVYAANINFVNVALADIMGAQLNCPVYIDNDANCAALGEGSFGAAKGSDNSVTITLGTGVGGGIIIGGSIYSGSFFGAGEIGHHVICMNGELCSCGAKGCWEAYASASALIRDTAIAARNNPESIINRLVNSNMDEITAKTAFDAASAGDNIAKAVVANYIDYLSIGLVNVINFLQPEVIVIGGGVSGQGSALISEIESRIGGFAASSGVKTRFVIAELGNDAGIIGAAQLDNTRSQYEPLS